MSSNIGSVEADFTLLNEFFRPFVGRYGLVRTLEREWDYYLDEPRWTWWRSELGCLSWLSNGSELDQVTTNGGRNEDERRAEMAALFESFERYSLATVSPTEHRSCVPGSGRFVGPEVFQYLDGVGSPDTSQGWIDALRLNDGTPVLVPAEHVRVPHYSGGGPNSALVRDPITTGAAAGLARNGARLRGALEVVERHTVMCQYFGTARCIRILPDGDCPAASTLIDDCARYGLGVELYQVSAGIACSVVIALVLDESETVPFTIGTSADLGLDEACVGAISESVFQRRGHRRRLHHVAEVSSREEIDGLEARSTFWVRSRSVEELRSTLNIGSAPVNRDNRPSVPVGEADFWASLYRESDVYEVDVTAPELAPAGVVVLKIIAPQLQPMYLDERFAGMVAGVARRGGVMPDLPHPFL